MFRFSLASLLLVVLFAAFGSAAVANPTNFWLQITVTLVVGTLLASTLAALFGRGAKRSFAGGFAIAGWLYFSLTFSAVFNLRHDLLTGRAIDWLQVVILHGPRSVQSVSFWSDGSWTAPGVRDGTIRIWDVSALRPPDKVRCFQDIGHSLWTIVVGYVGGIAATWLGRSPANQSGDG